MEMTKSNPPGLLPVSWQGGELRTVLLIAAVCSWFGLFIAVQQPGSLVNNLITINSIGLSQWSLSILVRLCLRGRLPAWGLALAIPLGWILGSKIAGLLGAPDIAALTFHDPSRMRQTILDTVLIGIVVTAFFLYFSHGLRVREELERERRRAAEALQAETAARLAMLQAQIEPHFLFNTLANIHSLIEEQPGTASLILENLNAYLRTSLRRTRQSASTLGEEIDLVRALLAIAAARLGPKLSYDVVVAEELRSRSLPPLLLQPLVENALLHGVEPSVCGAQIHIGVEGHPEELELTVADTGVGLDRTSAEGVGLANVRARLASLFGQKARLALYENTPRGVIAKLIVPTPS